MKKKHWQVSVFDKTSEIIRDDTFYTTDTEVYLVFELIDKDFKPDSATVTIYNVYGTATINERVDIVDGIVRYEIPLDAIGHQGGWRTQVVFTKDNEDYTTTVIEFDVDGHLLDNNKPTIVNIENWNSFIKHGERLVDDWEQLEKIRQANERKRERSESTRQNTFWGNESTRQANEQGRVSAESERVSNEEERISKDSERDSKIEEIERVATEPPKPIHTLKVENKVFSSDEVSVSEGVITINNHNLNVGDKVAFVATATSYNVYEPFEGDMRLNTVYYVVNPTSDSLQISTAQNGEPIVFNMDAKGFLWQLEKVNVSRLEVRRLDGTKYRVVFTGAHEGRNLSRRLLNVYTNSGNVPARYSSEDNENTMTATNISPVHGVTDIYSEMIFKVINRKILITVDSSFTTIGETRGNHTEETYRNRILTRTNNPTVGFQDSINVIGIGGLHLFDGSTMEVYEI